MTTTTSPLDAIREAVAATAERVFTEPVRQDGLVVIPAAAVGAGGGGGSGETPGPGGRDGGGLGLRAKPAGALVIKDGRVRWLPAVDVNRIVLGGQVVAIMALLVARALIRARSRSHR